MRSRLGAGTTVLLVLVLPIAAEGARAATAGPPSVDPLEPDATWRPVPSIAQAEKEGTLALLVDDHPINRALLLRQVNKLGYAAEAAGDGEHALALWRSGRFGAVVTDCNMPNMDGYELARRIRSLEAQSGKRRVPIIACTANAMRGEPEKCFEAGMDDYLVKPIELKQLLRKLNRWVPLPDTAYEASSPAPLAPILHSKHKDGLVDLALVSETFASDPSGVNAILAALRATNEQDVEVLRQAIEANDLNRVTYASHRMLGAGKMIGASEFTDICQSLEDGSRAGDWNAIRDAMPAFDAQWLRLKNYLDAF